MAQRFKALGALAEDIGSISSVHMVALITSDRCVYQASRYTCIHAG